MLLRLKVYVSTLTICLLVSTGSYAQESWSPFPADIITPPFSDDGDIAKGFYEAYPKATQNWNVCVSFPHLKDDYWNAVNYGIAKEAERLGVRLNLYEAGGYENLTTQIEQVRKCIADGADGLILSAIDFDALNPLIDEIMDQGIPVIDLINGVSSTNISARAIRPYYDLAFETGQFISTLLKREGWVTNTGRNARIAWFPGPDGAGWAESGNRGFEAGIQGAPVDIVSVLYGDTGRSVQGELIEQALAEHKAFDFIVGTTVTAEAAMRIVNQRDLRETTRVLSYYFSPGVQRGIMRGIIVGAPTDNQAIQARIAMDQVVRILEGAPVKRHVAVRADFISRANINEFDANTSLAPVGFRPVFVIN